VILASLVITLTVYDYYIITAVKDDVMKSELQKIAEANPRKFDPSFSYGIIEPTYDYDDKLYTLTYDPEISKVLINRIIIKGFQINNFDVEQVFIDVFNKLANDNKYKTKFDHDYVTKAEVKVKANQAEVVINNIKIPKKLRNVMFSSSNRGETLHVQTVVTKRLALKNSLDVKAIDNYFAELLRKDPTLRVPKTY